MNKKKYSPDDLIKHYFSGAVEDQKGEAGDPGGSIPQEHTEEKRQRAQKLPRINMAFTEENLEYLHIISAATGKSITQYVNDLVREDRETQGDLIAQVQKLMKEIKR